VFVNGHTRILAGAKYEELCSEDVMQLYHSSGLSGLPEQANLTIHKVDNTEGVETRINLLSNGFHGASAWRTSDFDLNFPANQTFRAT